jgi:type IV pilus assembly protein PilB
MRVAAPLGTRRRLGEILIAKGYLSPDGLEAALAKQRQLGPGKLLGEVLVEDGLCTEEQITECLAEENGIPFARIDARLFDPSVVELVPREYIENNLVLPLFRVRHTLFVATSEPANPFLIDELRALTGLEIELVAATARDIRRAITSLPNSRVFVIDDIIGESAEADLTLIEEAIEDLGNIEEAAGQSPVIRLVNYIIYNAVREGASDIHIEPADRCVRVRYRIDGRLHKALEVPLHLLPALTSRIKIMASLDISERRLPQDGRIQAALEGRKIDLRVSIFPTIRGEKTVIRVLDTKNLSLNLEELGFAEEVLAKFRQQIEAPNGIILVTGPTGSGKSTTLYAALNEIASMEINVCTVEDPIEYHLPFINQFQVQEKIGLTFSRALRTLLRQDPDVIMVGEIRDEETARTAIQAALTGHLVLSTLHTNDAVATITRLLNMGIESYLISAALNAVLAQRLVRRICSKCRHSVEVPRPIRKMFERLKLPCETLWRGMGCRSCRNTGYKGRLGLHELLIVTEEMRDLIVAQANVTQLRRLAIAEGMVELRIDGLRKAREGLTSVEEVFRVVGETGE